jgi:LCP family protein required for cell wall assembly
VEILCSDLPLTKRPRGETERLLVSSRTTEDVRPVASLQSAQKRSERISLRRGLTYVGMTLILPGSAQIAAGNMRVGRAALRAWAALWAVLLITGILAALWPSGAVDLFALAATPQVIQAVLVIVGIGWIVLLVDAWRISRPPDLARRHRLGFALMTLLVILAIVSAFWAAASVVAVQRDVVQTVFAGGGDKAVKAGRYNILLMGGDAGKDRVGLRPDSMTVASVDAETGRTVLISLPRNMERVPLPDWSPLRTIFPNGYYCSDRSCMLNAVYTYAMSHRNLYPGVPNPGAEATKEAIEGATGLRINYWVLVDLKGFESLVDAVGGITMDVYRRVPIGGGSSKIYGYVEAGKNRHLDGREALWFARSRSDSSDYDRIVRQKCVMNAMLNQLDPVTVLTNSNKIAAAGKEVLATNIPASDLSNMVELALAAKKSPVSSLALVPPLIHPSNPNFGIVRDTVAAKIAAAEAADAAASQPSPTGEPTASPSARQKSKKSSPTRGPETNDLTKICAA